MKRCPECLFLYPDSDEKCDFDQTVLEAVDDSALEPAPRPKKRSLAVPVAAAIVLILGVVGVTVYYAFSHRTQKASAVTENTVNVPPTPTPTAAAPSPSPSQVPSPSPSATPSSTPKASPSISTAHTRATSDPVSTSGPGIGTRQGGKPVILLASGGKIDADEVWRTKDGVWYRRNGIVTLLKRGLVKNIVTR